MKKYLLVFITLFLSVGLVWAASVTAPANLPSYYSSYINNKSGSTLFTGIHNVAGVGFVSISYAKVWEAYETTDTKSDGTSIYDYYSYCSDFTYYSSQEGKAPNNKNEGDCYNREHSIPKSWFGGTTDKDTPGTDLFHLVPADKIVNSLRSNHAYGEVTEANASSKTKQGCGTNENPLDNYCRYGTASSITISNTILSSGSSTQSTSVTVFEPLAEYKGDLARGYFGTLLKWAGEKWNENKEQTFTVSGTDGVEMFSDGYTASDFYGLTGYGVALLLKWHREDPVSQREIDRNNGIQVAQGNRNPFIDYPILAEYIWGKYSGETFLLANAVGSFEDGFVVGVSDGDKGGSTPATNYTITWSKDGVESTTQVAEGTRPTPPSVENCSASRVFRGWTTNSSYSGNGSDLKKVQSDFPTASSAITYYAVFADKEGSGNDNEYAIYSGALTEGDYIIYYGGKAMKASIASSRLQYEEVTPANNKITTTDASIIWHVAASGNYWTIYNEGENKYAAGTEADNKAQLLASGTDDKSLWTASGTSTYEFVNKANAAVSKNANLRNNGTYGFACYSTSTGGALSLYKASGSATYSNYSTSCAVVPQVTITFHKNDGSSTTTTQQVPENTATALTANSWSRTHYTFQGWATSASGAKVYNDQQSVTINAALDLYAVWKEDDKYTVTWHTAEGAIPVVYYTGTDLELPDTPDDCETNVRIFKGWTATANYSNETSAPGNMFTEASGTVTANADYYAVYADKATIHEPILVTDTLTCVLINQSNYGDWSGKKSYSKAVYAGNTAGGTNYIQMRGSSSSGIVTTTSGGTARRIELKWKSTSDRKIDVYGKKSAYSSAADLYSNEAATKGVKLGSITYGTSTSLDIIVDSTYIGLRSNSNALYVDTIAIVWQTGTNTYDQYSNYSTSCAFSSEALAASDITTNSFIANWTDAGVSTYSLDVTTDVPSATPQAATFASYNFAGSMENWTTNDVSGYTPVWTQNNSYVKGSAYVNGAQTPNNAAVSWLISPSIDLTNAVTATLRLNHVFRFASTLYLMISTNNGDSWTTLSPSNWSSASSWSFVDSEVNLSAYVGETILIGFKYESTVESCGTWEIKTCTISGTAYGTTRQSLANYPKNVTDTSAAVTGLTQETTYYYTVTPEGRSKSNEIEVTTLKNSVPTGVENSSNSLEARKVLINNQLFILRGDKVYTLQGLQVK